jgi:6-phosphogluconate dehydrogenase (decarboxylating)
MGLILGKNLIDYNHGVVAFDVNTNEFGEHAVEKSSTNFLIGGILYEILYRYG